MFPQGEMMKREFFLRRITTLFILVFSLVFVASAQTDQGRIAGHIVDPNGAVVPGAAITVTNVGTNETRTVTASDAGYYVVPGLRAALYKVSATAASFAEKTVTGIQVSVGQQLDLDITLSPETQTVTVDVTDATEVGIDT